MATTAKKLQNAVAPSQGLQNTLVPGNTGQLNAPGGPPPKQPITPPPSLVSATGNQPMDMTGGNKVMGPPMNPTDQASTPPIPQWDAQQPMTGEQMTAEEQNWHDQLGKILSANTSPDFVSQYAPLLQNLQNQPTPQGPSAMQAFFSTLGSPHNAPGILENQSNRAMTAHEAKTSHINSLKEAILNAQVQEAMQKGNTKQAMEATQLLDEHNQKMKTNDELIRLRAQSNLLSQKNEAAEKRMTKTLSNRYSIAELHTHVAAAMSARNEYVRSYTLANGMPPTEDDADQHALSAIHAMETGTVTTPSGGGSIGGLTQSGLDDFVKTHR